MPDFLLVRLVFVVVFVQITCIDHHSDDSYPFLVKIEAKGKVLDCAGTILTPCTVLTSAHCIDGVEPPEVTIRQIDSTVTKHGVVHTVIHPRYNSTVLANDIALLQINGKFRDPWAAVTLNGLAAEKIFPKCNFFQILGWSGHIMKTPIKKMPATGTAEKPMKATIKLISNQNCSTLIKNFGGIFGGEEKFCGVPVEEGEEEGCFTGPGGPLMCSLQSRTFTQKMPKRDSQFLQQDRLDRKGILEDPIDLLENFSGKSSAEGKFKREVKNEVKNLQVGVVSWGKSCSKVPSVYVKTDLYCKWIEETTGKMTKKCAPGFKNFVFSIPLKSRGANLTGFGFFIFSVPVVLRFVDLLFQLF